MINEELILNLVEDMDKILYTFEKDGKFAMSSSIRNELFQEANASLKQVKEALAQPEEAGKCPNLKNCEGACFVCEYWNSETGEMEYPLAAQLAQEPDRQTLQANGTHPAPCARHCEAQAFKVEIRNLKKRLEQPAQEPVAWGYRSKDGEIYDCISPEAHADAEGDYKVPLYTTPPQRPWVGLTDDEIEKGRDQAVRWAEVALKEKNT